MTSNSTVNFTLTSGWLPELFIERDLTFKQCPDLFRKRSLLGAGGGLGFGNFSLWYWWCPSAQKARPAAAGAGRNNYARMVTLGACGCGVAAAGCGIAAGGGVAAAGHSVALAGCAVVP